MTKRAFIPLLILSAVFATTVLAGDFSPALSLGSAPIPARQDPRHDVAALRDTEGKETRGKSNEYLGYILAVDERGKLAELQIPTGVAVALSTDLLIDKGDHVRAPTISRGDILEMIRNLKMNRQPAERPLVEVKNER